MVINHLYSIASGLRILDFCKPLAISYSDEKWFIFFGKSFFIGYKTFDKPYWKKFSKIIFNHLPTQFKQV